MGAPYEVSEAAKNEKPEHLVFLDTFWIDQTEVTNWQFAMFLTENGNKVELGLPWYSEDNINKDIVKTNNDEWVADPTFANHPVDQVSWYGAAAYCAWVGRRLPTEAEWEKAARGVDKRLYPWWDDEKDVVRANFDDGGLFDGYARSAPVGSFPRGESPYQVLDMAGNVAEWVEDVYAEQRYQDEPMGGWKNPVYKDSQNTHRILRGGSYFDLFDELRSTVRNDEMGNYAFVGAGFRCARSVAQTERGQAILASMPALPTQNILVQASTPTSPALTATPLPTATPVVDEFGRPECNRSGLTWVMPGDGMLSLCIPEGEFLMGSDDADPNSNEEEKPQHLVFLDAFWIDSTEVTNAMYATFVQATGYQTLAERENWSNVMMGSSWVKVGDADWQSPVGPGSDLAGIIDHPVVHIAWEDAQAYCDWVGGHLPSEAQWEKAARGEDGRLFPWGNSQPTGSLANFADLNLKVKWADQNNNDGFRYTAPVGSYPGGASPYGVMDMAGNVWEWVNDWFDEGNYFNSRPENPSGPDQGILRSLRGGAWSIAAQNIRTAQRGKEPPVSRYNDLGFRCVR
jgi:formylglycine-generating enzyme required for sulfatase activity